MERITYIYLYSNGEVRYIMNRSIPFENVVGKKLINILDAIGINMCTKIMIDLESELQKFKYSLDFESAHIKILETHSEWKNIKHSNQKAINIRKKELAEEYNAVVNKANIEVKEAESEISIFVVATIKKLLMKISNTIDTFIHSELKKENNELIIKNNWLNNYNDTILSKAPELEAKYNKYINEVILLEKKYNEYVNCINAIETKKKEYDMYSNKVEDLKLEINKLNLKLALLAQKEGKLYANL